MELLTPLPHILEDIFYHKLPDEHDRQACLCVCSEWNAVLSQIYKKAAETAERKYVTSWFDKDLVEIEFPLLKDFGDGYHYHEYLLHFAHGGRRLLVMLQVN